MLWSFIDMKKREDYRTDLNSDGDITKIWEKMKNLCEIREEEIIENSYQF